MAQHDYVIANGTGAAVRSDLNNALAAIVTQNSGATAPSTTYAYQWWADTTTGLLKLRNAANNAWITLFQLDGEWSTLAVENGSAAAPSIYFKDSGTDTGIYSPGTDQVAISTGGTVRLSLSTTAVSSALAIDHPLGAVGTPSITFTGDLNTGIYSPSADQLAIATNGVERVEWGTSEVVFNDDGANYDFRIEGDTNSSLFFVDASAEAVGIGTASPGALLHAAGKIRFGSNATYYGEIDHDAGSTGSNIYDHSDSGGHIFRKNGNEQLRIDSSGRLLVGTSSTSKLRTLVMQGNSGSANDGGNLQLSTGLATPANGDSLGYIMFADSTHDQSAQIVAQRDGGTWSASSKPTRLLFSTTADGASSPTERMRIDKEGSLLIGKTANDIITAGHNFYNTGAGAHSASAQPCLYVNRITNDGTVIEIRQDNAAEGTISVSGTTVSYNGAHLSRWSQLPGNAERTEILRGTILSNIDEMCDWGEEANEQLNRMKVSDVVGDPNVAGVFQAWDDDDDTYTDDFYCAMTGDFIIRIAAGTPVHRGQLLMSAGDGTAIPQDDDIVRSKTVAKVTSHHVTCTYDDGSYCVPCVLMAC